MCAEIIYLLKMGKSMRGLLWLNNVGIPNLNHQQSPKKNDIFFYVIKNKNECKSGEREREKTHNFLYNSNISREVL